MSSQEQTKNKKLIAGVALLALSGAIIVSAAVFPSQSSSANNNKTNSSTPTTTTKTVSNVSYKDGTYAATGQYFSPGGKELVHVSLTLASNVVSDATVQSGANDPTAVSYQNLFISSYKPFVVGKNINSIKLTNVSGSSLTSQGFNNALKQIEQQAKA